MHLNIKNGEAHKLARSLSRETGESLTEAVTNALRERLEKVRLRKKQKRIATELDAISRRAAKILGSGPIDHAEMLYDENGLPK